MADRREGPDAKRDDAEWPRSDCIPAITEAMNEQMGECPWKRRAQGTRGPEQGSPREWEKLIRKLRWIGLEDEARRLELAVSTVPPEERGSVAADPLSTD